MVNVLATWPDALPQVQMHKESLEWTPPPSGAPLPWVTTCKEPGKWLDSGAFSSALKPAGILDHRAIAVPGAVVVLPYGMRLIKQFQELIRRFYQQFGLEEYEYPTVAPLEIYDPIQDILPLDNKLLHLGTDSDFAQQRPQATLCPSGEATIYAHWKTIVRSPADLPLRVYRQARYYRPTPSGKHSGRSIFRPLESADVFEFHCGFAGYEEGQQASSDYFAMLRAIASAAHVPTLWSTRPPWTNNRGVAEWAIGGDVPLPSGNTVQTASLYNQGQIFSRACGIRFKQGGKLMHPYHITGAITRRLAYVHLMLGMYESGALFVHPDFSPDQVAIVFQQRMQDDSAHIQKLLDTLTSYGLRLKLDRVEGKNSIAHVRRSNRLRGVPLEILVQGRRNPNDRFRVVLTRADTYGEAILFEDMLLTIGLLVPPIVHNVGVAYVQRVRQFFERQCCFASRTSLNDILGARRVAVCPLVASEKNTLEVDGWHRGEILGYARGHDTRPCVLTGERTDTVALISPRV